jgi:predicted ATP-grasp superfamily ATP-dependent carboligase
VAPDDVWRRVLVQSYVAGEVHDACLLLGQGQVRAAVAQRRLKMYPATGGVGILNETTYEPALIDHAARLMQTLNWNGPAMVEFMVVPRTGDAFLLDVNCRWWGTLDLSIQAGVDFPYLLCRLAMGDDAFPAPAYRVGLRYRWPYPYGWQYARPQKHRWRAFWEFVRPEAGMRSDLWIRDPLPHLVSFASGRLRRWLAGTARP